MQDVDVTIITCGGTITGEYSLFPQVRLAKKKKVQFDVNPEKDTLFEAWDDLHSNSSKLAVYNMPIAFDSTLEARPLRQDGTLQNFFESYLSLERDPDALAEIETLLH